MIVHNKDICFCMIKSYKIMNHEIYMGYSLQILIGDATHCFAPAGQPRSLLVFRWTFGWNKLSHKKLRTVCRTSWGTCNFQHLNMTMACDCSPSMPHSFPRLLEEGHLGLPPLPPLPASCHACQTLQVHIFACYCHFHPAWFPFLPSWWNRAMPLLQGQGVLPKQIHLHARTSHNNFQSIASWEPCLIKPPPLAMPFPPPATTTIWATRIHITPNKACHCARLELKKAAKAKAHQPS